MALIKKLIDNGTLIYPATITDAIKDISGVILSDRLENMQTDIDSKMSVSIDKANLTIIFIK